MYNVLKRLIDSRWKDYTKLRKFLLEKEFDCSMSFIYKVMEGKKEIPIGMLKLLYEELEIKGHDFWEMGNDLRKIKNSPPWE